MIKNKWLDAIAQIEPNIRKMLINNEQIKLDFLCESTSYSLKLKPASIGDGYYCCTVELLNQESSSWKGIATELKSEWKKQQKLLQDVLDSTDSLLYSVDLEGRIIVFKHCHL
ncbi:MULTISPECIES: hypothetical protein [Sphingobacterium]|uniref:hypothetical protein n=1 Tax=Sphingobacterium TaxID=28453 RepID=UPI002FDED137